MKKGKKIKKSHVLVVGSGPSLRKYWDKINKFIKTNDLVIFGCNNIMDFLSPDYHFWGSSKRWRKFADKINPKTVLVTSKHFNQKVIRKKWKGEYKTFNNVERVWRIGSDKKDSPQNKRCQVNYINGKMFGCVRDIATWAIFYAYIKGAFKITVIGNDGYTLYSKSDLESKKYSQHCYGRGLTDGFIYEYCRKKDWDKYKTLRLLHEFGKKKYGFGFEIITPTIYDKFYNYRVLNIKKDIDWQKWEEPSSKEYKSLYIDSRKNNCIVSKY